MSMGRLEEEGRRGRGGEKEEEGMKEGGRKEGGPLGERRDLGLISLCRFAANLISGVLSYKALLDR